MKMIQSKLYTNKLFLAVLLIVVLWNSGSALITIPFFFKYAIYGLVLTAIWFVPSIMYYFTENEVNRYAFAVLSLIIMISFTFITHYSDGLNQYLYIISIVILAFGITVTYAFDDFVNTFLKIMVFISIIALFGFYVFRNTALVNLLPSYINGNNIPYNVGFIWNNVSLSDRNYGMFWEPGVFASFLVFAIVFEIIYKKKRVSIVRLILFTVCIISTASAAGYALLTACIILFFVSKEKKRSENGLSYVFFTCVIIAGLIIYYNADRIILNTSLINNDGFAKLISDRVVDSSRMLSIYYYLDLFYKNPIFGAGYVQTYLESAYSGTSTSTIMLSIFGVLGSSYTLFFIYGVFSNKSRNFYAKIILVTIILSILNKEPHTGILFTWVFLFYLLKNSVSAKEVLKK